MASERQSVIERSAMCSANWLWETLDVPWFGDLEIKWSELEQDVRPQTVGEYGQNTTGVC